MSIPNHAATSFARLAALFGGIVCAQTLASPEKPIDAASAASSKTHSVSVRQGRFALVELRPEAGQRDLLLQIVETDTPNSLHPTVGAGLHYLLARSGFRLCESQDVAALGALPLPAAHLHLGPMTLRDALATMAGPAWTLSVDEVSRIVCFARTGASDGAALPKPTGKSSVGQP